EGLRWRSLFSRCVGLGNGSFFDGPEWRAGHSIEHVEKSLFGGLRHDVDIAAVVAGGQELGCPRGIVGPQIMMDGLEVPEALSGAGIERHQAVAEQVVAMPIATVEVEPRGAKRHVDDAASLIDRQFAPVVDTAA